MLVLLDVLNEACFFFFFFDEFFFEVSVFADEFDELSWIEAGEY